MYLTKRLLLLLLPISLTGCTYIPKSSVFANRENAYLAAKSIPPLKIPPGLSSSAFHNYYPVSDRDYPGYKNVNIIPPGL